MSNEVENVEEVKVDNSGWNRVGDANPQESEDVLLTFKNYAGVNVDMATYIKGKYYYIAQTDEGYYEELYTNPIAWMKLPKPYNGQ